MSKSIVTKRHYLVVSERREVIQISLSYMEALSTSALIPGGWVLEIMAKRVQEALRTASRDHQCRPTPELVSELNINWVFAA